MKQAIEWWKHTLMGTVVGAIIGAFVGTYVGNLMRGNQ